MSSRPPGVVEKSDKKLAKKLRAQKHQNELYLAPVPLLQRNLNERSVHHTPFKVFEKKYHSIIKLRATDKLFMV